MQCSVLSSGSAWSLENDPSCVVPYSLQLLDAVAWSAVEHSIEVVDPGHTVCNLKLIHALKQDQTTGHAGSVPLRSQQVPSCSVVLQYAKPRNGTKR